MLRSPVQQKKCLIISDQVSVDTPTNNQNLITTFVHYKFVDIEYLAHVRGDVILDDTKYGTMKVVIKAVLKKSPQQITIPELDHNGNGAGTRIVWLPRRLFDDFKTQGLWPLVKLDEYGETEEVYTEPVVI